MVVETGLLLKLPSLAGFNLSFMNTGVPPQSLSVLPPRQAEDAPEVDLVYHRWMSSSSPLKPLPDSC